MKKIDENINFDIREIAKFLEVAFDRSFFCNLVQKKDKKKELESVFGYSQINRWLKGNYEKNKIKILLKEEDKDKQKKISLEIESKNQPGNAEKVITLAGILDLDPFLLYKVNYKNWCDVLKSFDGNISMSKLINFGKIHPSLTFVEHFFSMLATFPNPIIIEYWNKKRDDDKKSNWETVDFESNLKKDDPEVEQLIFIQPSQSNQVIHLSYYKIKPVNSLEVWQEYKLVFIRPVKDIMYFISTTDIWNNKTEDEKKELNEKCDVVLVMNICGGIKFDFIPKEEPFLIKTKFVEEGTKFKVSSAHHFNLELVSDNKNNIKTVFERPC